MYNTSFWSIALIRKKNRPRVSIAVVETGGKSAPPLTKNSMVGGRVAP
jgi:hypothetical protein